MTGKLLWTEAFSIGHRELDGEHRRITELINTICASTETEALLKELEEVARAHFTNEERVIREISQNTSNPKLRRTVEQVMPQHIADHGRRLDDLRQLSGGLDSSDVTGSGLCL